MVITIDGKQVEAQATKNVLETALDAGIYIPHLCHHPSLKASGACKMCIVEVEGRAGVLPACELHPENDMVVRTDSEEIKRLRMLALELLLTGHPEDCTTCPKYGNCELQMLIQYIGPKTGRLKMRNKGFVCEESNPLIIHDMNRCILCGRCVRACNELRGVGVLQYQKREMETYIGTAHNDLIKDDCRFCTACVEVCPTGAIRDRLKLGAEHAKSPEELVPCRGTCPAHTDVPRYIRCVKEGKYDEAAAVVREKLPFPKSLGYVCNHACEAACRRAEVNDAISIREIKRYAAEQDGGSYWRGKGKQLPSTHKKVCVVGGGPSGLTAAYYLSKQGHSVTLKEALPKAGGMLQYGIPAYRLPRSVIDEEIRVIAEAGVKIELNARVETLAALRKEFDAILLAVGNHVGVRLPMEGNDLPGVLLNIDFLRNASMEKTTGIGKRVVVLGGGNVAFDCARTAKRLGAEEVHLACLEARESMPADEEEIAQAMQEGISIHPGQSFERITGSNHVTGVDFMNVKAFRFDESFRTIIEKEEGSSAHIEADSVIFATGQRASIPESDLVLGRGDSIVVSEPSKATNIAGVFAAGDVIYGTKSVVMAVQSGREAASEIDIYLGGDGDITETLAPTKKPDSHIGPKAGFGYEKRAKTDMLTAEERNSSFNLVDRGLCSSTVCGEASRCLQCDLRLQIRHSRTWKDFGFEKEALR